MDASVTFACVLRSGGVYDARWVERLCRQVREHLKPDRIVCLSDCETGLTRGFFPDVGTLDIWYVPLVHRWPGWFSKLELFRPDLFSGPVVYSDLDSLLLAPIDLSPVWAAMAPYSAPALAMLSDFFNPKIPASGVMVWTPCSETEMIYRRFVSKPQISTRWSEGDGYHIGETRHLRLQDIMPATFASYKAHKLQNTHAGFPHVSFHGKPKQNDFPPDHWVSRAWLNHPCP